MNETAKESSRDAPDVTVGPQNAAEPPGTYKTKLLEEYTDHVGGGGFTAWGSWTYSI